MTQLIDTQRDVCQRMLADLRAHADAFAGDRDYDWLVLQFRIMNLETILAWPDVCTTTLAASLAP